MSVIIPVYNIERHLAQCLDSVAGQSLRDIEVICVDDGSTDGSPAILAWYAARDARFRIAAQANAGPGAARNTGLALATGEYVVFLDSDDWIEPDFLEKMTARAVVTAADVTICRAVEFDTDTGRELPSGWMLKREYLPESLVFAPEDVADRIFQFTYGWPWDKLWRLGYIRERGLSYQPLRHSEDLGFTYLGLASAGRIAVLDRVLVHHRVNRAASVSNRVRAGAPEQLYEAVRRFREDLKGRGLYGTYERSFLNWAMKIFVWNVAALEDGEDRERCFRELKCSRLPDMGFEKHPPSYYNDRIAYAKYLLVRYAPYPVFRAVLASYRACKRDRG